MKKVKNEATLIFERETGDNVVIKGYCLEGGLWYEADEPASSFKVETAIDLKTFLLAWMESCPYYQEDDGVEASQGDDFYEALVAFCAPFEAIGIQLAHQTVMRWEGREHFIRLILPNKEQLFVGATVSLNAANYYEWYYWFPTPHAISQLPLAPFEPLVA